MSVTVHLLAFVRDPFASIGRVCHRFWGWFGRCLVTVFGTVSGADLLAIGVALGARSVWFCAQEFFLSPFASQFLHRWDGRPLTRSYHFCVRRRGQVIPESAVQMLPKPHHGCVGVVAVLLAFFRSSPMPTKPRFEVFRPESKLSFMP